MSRLLHKTNFALRKSWDIASRQILTSAPLSNKPIEVTSKQASELKVGDVVHGFKLEGLEYIKELNIRPYYLRHERTGAAHLHIQNDTDGNNVFSVSLRTTPKNSTGVAHILEHLALCGSKRFAVRDPFFKMTTRSLATFMNAMTGPDFTVYPFSTQNVKDYENMLNVYTDAVFFPRLRPVDFRQEGWRLEHENPEDRNTPLVLRGVVYNEMKGVFSSSSSIYGRQVLNNLFPDTTYQYESGGDPDHIPRLSYEELKKFHLIHYHPSNAKFFTYGDMPLENHLKLIDSVVLSKFSENSQARERSAVQDQAPWTEPRTVHITCPPDPLSAHPEKQATTSVSYMLPTNITNYQELFALQILSSLLIDGPNAPFHKSLLESGLGSDFSPSTGLGTYTKQPYFSVGLQNLSTNDIPKVHKIIEDTLIKASQEGFERERIEALLHNIELGLKHIRGNFGLRLLMNLGSTWNHDGDVIDYLRVNKYVERFKQDSVKENFWKHLIEENFLKNKHKLILTMNADEKFEEQRKEREQKLLEDKVSQLSDIDRQTLYYEGVELKLVQDSKDDPSILPCLEPSKDISRELAYTTKLDFEECNGVKIQVCEQPTNEVVYFRALVDVGDKLIDSELIDYLPLFCDVATKLGAGKYSRHELAQKEQLHTGGLGVTMMLNPSFMEFDKFRNEVCFGSHCLSRNVKKMFELWLNLFEQIHFDDNKEYIVQLIKQHACELSEGIPHNGHSYAIKRSAASLSNISALEERLSGLTFVTKMKDIASKEAIDDTVEKLKAISRLVFNPHNMRCAINSEKGELNRSMEELRNFIQSAQQTCQSVTPTKQAKSGQECSPPNVEDMRFNFNNHYVAKAMVGVPRVHPDFAKLLIMTKLVSSKFLLREVREKGGAYGAGLKVSDSGILNFYSYRDPNTTQTLEAFDRSAKWLVEADEYNERDVEESKLGVFQGVDKPVEPGRRGFNHFVFGETDEMRAEFRRRLLDVTQDDVIDVAKKYLNQEKTGAFVL